jgi:two-component system KDP operon response regulator KdpE
MVLMKPLILMIEDDAQIRRFLRATLTAEDYQFHEAVNAQEGIAQAAARQPDLVLLDLGLPDQDGLEVIRQIRRWSQMPVVVLSARGQEKDKISALDLGADDYVAKPFAVGELLARIRAALRRAAPAAADGANTIIRFGDVEADFEKRQITVGGREVHLTPNEYKLLQVLIKYAGRVVTQRQLLNEVWGPQHTEQSQYLRVYVAQLRRKRARSRAPPLPADRARRGLSFVVRRVSKCVRAGKHPAPKVAGWMWQDPSVSSPSTVGLLVSAVKLGLSDAQVRSVGPIDPR